MKICELEECGRVVFGYKYGSDDLKRYCCKEHQQKDCNRRHRQKQKQKSQEAA